MPDSNTGVDVTPEPLGVIPKFEQFTSEDLKALADSVVIMSHQVNEMYVFIQSLEQAISQHPMAKMMFGK